MATYRQINHLSPRLWIALAATLFAGLIAILASLNLYLLEDDNPLTTAAYSASPLLRFSYDGAYLSALVAVVTICALVTYALVRTDLLLFMQGQISGTHFNSLLVALALELLSLIACLLGIGFALRSTARLS